MRPMIALLVGVALASCGSNSNNNDPDSTFTTTCKFAGSCDAAPTATDPDPIQRCFEWTRLTLETIDVAQQTEQQCKAGGRIYSNGGCPSSGAVGCCTFLTKTTAPGDEVRSTSCYYGSQAKGADVQDACVQAGGTFHIAGSAPEALICSPK